MSYNKKAYKQFGEFLSHDDTLDYEEGIFSHSYSIFKRVLNKLNKKNRSVGLKIDFILTNSFKFNAHALKLEGNEYLIAFRAGVVTKTLHALGADMDFYKDRFESPELGDIEAPLAIGCFFVWHQMFFHEIGHILRGHSDIVNDSNMISMIGGPQEILSSKILTDLSLSNEDLKFLMEIDADVFSAALLAHHIHSLILKPMSGSAIPEKDILTIFFGSIFFFFNWVCEVSKDSGTHPPAMLRSHILFEEVIRNLDGKLKIPRDEITGLMRQVTFDCYSYLHDHEAFAQGMSHEKLDRLEALGQKARAYYPAFSKYVVENLSKVSAEVEIDKA